LISVIVSSPAATGTITVPH